VSLTTQTIRLASEKSNAARPRALKVICRPEFSFLTVISGLKTLGKYSDLLYTLTMLRLSVRYKQSALGWIWAVLQPLALMISYTAIFSRVAKLPSEGIPYPVFVLTALLPWVFFSTAVSNATMGIVNYSHLVTKVYFPREIITLSYIAAALFDFCIASSLLGLLMLYYKISLSWKVLYVLPIIAVLIAFTAAVSLIVSAFQVRVRDVSMAVPLVLQVCMFATPVVYPLQSVPASIRRIYLLNPVAVLIDSFRRVLLHGDSPSDVWVGIATVITILSLVLAYASFKSLEATMADYI
jgi:lipopolysaccharide transport system permease protein